MCRTLKYWNTVCLSTQTNNAQRQHLEKRTGAKKRAPRAYCMLYYCAMHPRCRFLLNTTVMSYNNTVIGKLHAIAHYLYVNCNPLTGAVSFAFLSYLVNHYQAGSRHDRPTAAALFRQLSARCAAHHLSYAKRVTHHKHFPSKRVIVTSGAANT